MGELGWIVEGWKPARAPERRVIEGDYARLEPLDRRHAADLHMALQGAEATWDYLPYGPFFGIGEYSRFIERQSASRDPLFFALIDRATRLPGGVMSLMRITPESGTIEVGHVCLAPRARRSRAATEAIFLLAANVFAWGYRRFEWKCDALNLPSRRAAERFGFSYEGVFRRATVVKGRNRDTAWFAMVDGDWPCLGPAYAEWLDPANFDGQGRQVRALSELTAPCLVARDPGLG
ncbi:GNAT family N-acetyltransferase [Amaricoccus solimangrovi]|uniref:GNAT family N-acetyltransferase n=1 Tax=Amaricoccus solimangrovi TaxID=2589815 RepID=A0A501WRN9_9RHOB|nr:GNAT family protein [Amaricoccus solimangrovi]TPE51492.1 GNAT family N-acetyltransferase [Amaricoccus solimangrovi]